jgi:multidrug efflux pump subunit AcrB/outer membrane protein TolC
MKLSSWAFSQKRLAIAISLIFVAVGLSATLIMAREEDPKLADRFGALFVIYPGADPLTFERTVIEPIEEELKTIEGIKKIQTTIRPDFSMTEIELQDSVQDIEKVWNEARSRLEIIKSDFPALVRYNLDRSPKVEGILLALPVRDPLLSLDLARELKDEILAVKGVALVNIHGVPEEEIQVQLSPQKMIDRGLGFGQVLEAIRQSNSSTPGGLSVQQNQNILLMPNSRLQSVEQVGEVALPLSSGEVISLKQIASIQRGQKNPPLSLSRLNSKEVYVLGVALSHPNDVVKVGATLRKTIKNFETEKNIKIEEITFQPDRTEIRLSELFVSLLTGVLSVGILLALWSGWRFGLVVALSVPAITLIGLAVYFMGGGVLHQISLAAFVLSLGQFIDNIIVVVEAIQRRINEGLTETQAAIETISEFSRPMIFATGTGAAAFIPMLASTGGTAEFTFAIPLIAILTLIISYFFAILAAPLMASWILVKDLRKSDQQTMKLADWISGWVLNKPVTIVFVALVMLITCGIGFSFVKKQFFPEGDRNELIVRIEKAQGSSFESTNALAKKIEEMIIQDKAVKLATSFIGQGTPYFYYNLQGILQNTAMAEILVVTKDLTENHEFAARAEAWVKENVKDARVTVLALEQGPPVKAPIELRLVGNDFVKLEKASQEILAELKKQAGLREAHIVSGEKVSSQNISLKDQVAAKYGVSREVLAWTALATTGGVEITKYTGGKKSAPLRVSFKEQPDLNQMPIAAAQSRSIRTSEVATIEASSTLASIQRIGGERMMSIVGYLKNNVGYNEVMNPILEVMNQKAEANGVKLQIGGQAEGSEEASVAIFRAIPLGVILLLTCLLLQFNSFAKILLIFLALPLTITGIVPGLLLGNAPFGFMSLLGLLALIGIVVNNAILLLETLDGLRREGLSIEEAITKTLRLRLQPILLTALLTVVGLLPLAFESSTLWPPLAWTMISGLLASTFLTLGFLPALYLLMEKKLKISMNTAPVILLVAAATIFTSNNSEAKTYSLKELMQVSDNSFIVQSKKSETESAHYQEKSQFREAFLPKLGAFAETKSIDRKLFAPSVIGPQEYGKQVQLQAGIELTQPLFNYAQMGPAREATELLTEAKIFEEKRTSVVTKIQVLQLALQNMQVQEEQQIVKNFVVNLSNQKNEVERFFNEGRASRADMIKVQIEKSSAESSLDQLAQAEKDLIENLRIFIPDLEKVEATHIPKFVPSKLESISNLERSDLKAIQKSVLAQEQATKAVRAGHLPVIQAYGRGVHSDQGTLIDKNWWELGVRLSIPLFEGGVRRAQTQIQSQNAQALKLQESGATAKIQAEIAEAVRGLELQRLNLERTERDLKMANQMVNEERLRFKRGRISLTDLLDAERLLLQQKRLLISYKFGKMQAGFKYYLVTEKEIPIEEEN